VKSPCHRCHSEAHQGARAARHLDQLAPRFTLLGGPHAHSTMRHQLPGNILGGEASQTCRSSIPLLHSRATWCPRLGLASPLYRRARYHSGCS